MELKLWWRRVAPMVGFPVACAATMRCDPSRHADCAPICMALDGCHYLPSALGATGAADASDGDLVGSCESRCNLSSDPGPFTQIDDCWNQAGSAQDECLLLALCLHASFPATPITGVARVTLNADAPDASDDDDDSGAITGCRADAGANTTFAQAFVDEWGVRRPSTSRACSFPLLFVFEDVPAGPSVAMGVQLTVAGVCSEYDVEVPVNASADLLVPVPLDGHRTCLVEPMGDGGGMGGAFDASEEAADP
jgi:hypothetical protein